MLDADLAAVRLDRVVLFDAVVLRVDSCCGCGRRRLDGEDTVDGSLLQRLRGGLWDDGGGVLRGVGGVGGGGAEA